MRQKRDSMWHSSIGNERQETNTRKDQEGSIVTSGIRTGTRKAHHHNRQSADFKREISTGLRGRCRYPSRSRSLLPLLLQFPQMRRRIQTPAAALHSTEARSLILAIVQVVIVGQFLPGLDVAQGDDPHLAADLVGFAVRLARMIHKRRHSTALNDHLSPVQPKQVRVGKVVIKIVRLFVGQRHTRVFNDQGPLADSFRGIAAVAMNARLANDERHSGLLSLAHPLPNPARGNLKNTVPCYRNASCALPCAPPPPTPTLRHSA